MKLHYFALGGFAAVLTWLILLALLEIREAAGEETMRFAILVLVTLGLSTLGVAAWRAYWREYWRQRGR